MQQRQNQRVMTKAQTCDLVFEASQITARPACKDIKSADFVCRIAARLFVQLVDLFRFYMAFPIDDHTGDPVTDEEVTAAHYEKVQQVCAII